MKVIVVGPGRAGRTMILACQRAGHEVVGVVSRNAIDPGWPPFSFGDALPEADLLLLTVSDDAIAPVAESLSGTASRVAVAAHMSGFAPVAVLRPLREGRTATGGFHPLVSMPDPEAGLAGMAGAYVGIGGAPLAVDVLSHLADSIGLTSFRLEDETRPAYHAAAAAAANFVVSSLAVSADLFESVAINPLVVRPLVEKVVSNFFDLGPSQSLTGPIARGDVDTVIGHLIAASDVSRQLGDQFRHMAEATAIRAGREEDLKRWR